VSLASSTQAILETLDNDTKKSKKVMKT